MMGPRLQHIREKHFSQPVRRDNAGCYKKRCLPTHTQKEKTEKCVWLCRHLFHPVVSLFPGSHLKVVLKFHFRSSIEDNKMLTVQRKECTGCHAFPSLRTFFHTAINNKKKRNAVWTGEGSLRIKHECYRHSLSLTARPKKRMVNGRCSGQGLVHWTALTLPQLQV